MMTLPSYSLLNSVEARLKSLTRDISNEAALAQNFAFMQELAAEEAPRRLIAEVLANDTLLSQIACRSYKHANNFEKILLFESCEPDQYRMSIHRWHSADDEPVPKDEPVHNHRFSFWSHIFCGTMPASIYAQTDDTADEIDLFPKYKYLPARTGNIHACEYQGEVRLKKLHSVTYTCGDVYYLNYDVLHRVHAAGRERELCTLVLRGPRQREYAETYNTSYPRGQVAYNTPVMKPDHLRTVLASILEAR